MNIEKAEVKLGTAHELGCRLDDSKEAFQKEVSQWEGANAASLQITKGIEDLAKHVDKDIDQGLFDLETGVKIKKYITRAAAVASSVAAQASNNTLVARGKVQAMEVAVTVAKKLYDEERSKVEAYKRAIEAGQIRVEPDGSQQAVVSGVTVPGVRPGMSIKEQRLAEEAAAAASGAPSPASEVEEAAAALVPEVGEPPAPKRGGRGKRATNT